MKKLEMTRDFTYGVGFKNHDEIKEYNALSKALDYAYRWFCETVETELESEVMLIYMVKDSKPLYPFIKCSLVEGKMVETVIPLTYKENISQTGRPVEEDYRNLLHTNTMRAFDKLVEDINAFKAETGDGDDTMLYENPVDFFYLRDIRLEVDGTLKYGYASSRGDWYDESEDFIWIDEDTAEVSCITAGHEGSLSDKIKFWRKCLNNAKKYWSMSSEELDKLQENYEG